MPEALTFVFADLESSTRLWERFPEAMSVAMERHDAILREAVEGADGRVVKITGDGLMAVFGQAADAVGACFEAQRALQDESWGEIGPLRVRMGVHAGAAQARSGDFFGPTVNRTARIMAAGHGGQVLLSALAAEQARAALPAEAALRDLGEHRLKDLYRPEHIFQLVHPRLAGDFPPLATLSARPNNLPMQTSEFLGREAQLSAVRDLLDSDGVRLLTVTGPGGIGKTRLALQGAADQIDRFADGVFFVDLSAARERDEALEAVVRAVGLTGATGDGVLEVLTQNLAGKRVLLVLDNFEQVMDTAEGIAELLRRCAELKVLVTSREALRVRGEHLLAVPPLELPVGGGSADTLAASEAVRLFVERAREVQPGFELTDANGAAVAEIVARLDGLPLAIELAAARLKLFSPEDLTARLRSRLELLGHGPRDLPVRQRTLRSTIEWSYELLDGEEQAVFALLSVFSPTRVESIEAVVERLGSLGDVDVVDRLTSLVEKSLVRGAELHGPRQLSMLETIREYAAERLEEEPAFAAAARRAHADHFADFAARRRADLHGPERDATLAALESELGNLLTAWRHWVGERDLERLAQLLDGLWVLHDARGWYHAALDLTDDLLAVLAAVPSTPELAREEMTLRAALARGLLALRGYTQEVEDAYNRALALADAAGDEPRRVPVLRSLASFHIYRGEFDKAAPVGRELLALGDRQGDTGLQVDGNVIVGSSLSFGGDVAAGLEHLDRAIAIFDPARDRPGPFRLGPSSGLVAHTASAYLLWWLGRHGRSAERAARALEVATELDHPVTRAYALYHVGHLDFVQGRLELAREHATGVREVADEHDYQIWRALGLVLQGAALAGLGEPDEGLARIDRGIALYQGMTTPPIFWPLLLSVRTRGLALAGRPGDGLPLVEEAIALSGGSADLLYPEFELLKGDLLLTLGEVADAEASFRLALGAAGESGARTPQLQAATRLTRLARAEGRQPDGTDVLLGLYEGFAGEPDSRDLEAARAVLDEANVRAG